MAPHSSTLAWKIPWMEEPGRLQSMGSLRVGHDSVTSLSLSCIGEGNGNPLQCSCLENPRDGGAWQAAIYGVIQSWTRLKRLSSSSIEHLWSPMFNWSSSKQALVSTFVCTDLWCVKGWTKGGWSNNDLSKTLKPSNCAPWKKSHDQPRQHIGKQRHYIAYTGPSSKGYGFSSGHVWMWELDCEESWVPKNWCFWTVVLEETLESPLACKKIQPVHPKGDQPWDFFGRNDAKAEAPVLWPPHVKSWLIGKDCDAGRDWGQEEKGTTEDEMAGWHHGLDGRGSEWTPGDGDGQGGLACCDS